MEALEEKPQNYIPPLLQHTPWSRVLRLVAETLLMATLLHALAALVLGNFRFASFFERAHSGFSDSRAGIQPSNPPRCNSLLCCGIVSLLVTCQIGKLFSEARPNGSLIYVVF